MGLGVLRTPVPKGFPKERELRFPQGRCGSTGNFLGYSFVQEGNKMCRWDFTSHFSGRRLGERKCSFPEREL